MAESLDASIEPVSINLPKVLLVEGGDEFRFFEVLLKQMGAEELVQIIPYGGKGNLKRFLRTLPNTPGFSTLKSLGVTRDADASAKSAFDSISALLKNAGFDAPQGTGTPTGGKLRVSVFTLPYCSNRGMLETLCLSAVKHDPATPCVEQYLQCLEETANLPSNNPDKARAHAFLASRPRPDLRVGEAAEAGHWHLDSPIFDPLKSFLLAL